MLRNSEISKYSPPPSLKPDDRMSKGMVFETRKKLPSWTNHTLSRHFLESGLSPNMLTSFLDPFSAFRPDIAASFLVSKKILDSNGINKNNWQMKITHYQALSCQIPCHILAKLRCALVTKFYALDSPENFEGLSEDLHMIQIKTSLFLVQLDPSSQQNSRALPVVSAAVVLVLWFSKLLSL